MMGESAPEKFFLYGPSGGGKSTLGRQLADRLDLAWLDLDTEIERKSGASIPEIFKAEGEGGFRKWESRLLAEACADPAGQVISLGGGALLSEKNRALAEASGRVLCLTASPDILRARLQKDQASRPLLEGDGTANLAGYLEKRAGHYNSFAACLDTTGLKPHEAVREAQIAFGAFRIAGMGAPYDVRVRSGCLPEVGQEFAWRGLHGPVSLVSDSGIAPLFAQTTLDSLRENGFEAELSVFPHGETNKTVETVGKLWDGFLRAGLERRSTVAALGGGVVGDLAGFAAATYLRGVPWVNLPTSLLAMVDASLGGKTGADLPQGKNLVGAFHAPALVLADPDTLRTLPEAEFRAGLAEVIKHGVIADPLLLAPKTFDGNLPALVARAMAVKIDVIAADPFEGGRREVLNYGHTIGHAVEHVSNFSIRHGEAVAIGMVAEARLAERLGLAAAGLAREVAYSLESVGLPTSIPSGLATEELLLVLNRDKKKRGGRVLFALPVRVGQVQRGIAIEERTLRAVLEAGK